MRIFAAVIAMMVSLVACAEESAPVQPQYEAGRHYQVLGTPVRTRDASKVEVAEVFWYGCGHCFTFEPMVQQWKKQQASDVYVLQSPALWGEVDLKAKPLTWRNPMAVHARAFYTAQALGVSDKVHMPIFNALNIERKKLATADELADLFASYGVEKETFIKAYGSFGITSQVQRAYSNMLGYKITGTPQMVVNGKYTISARMAGGQAEMLKVVDYLVAKERAAK